MSRKIFVGAVSRKIDQEAFEEYFQSFGKTTECKLITRDGVSRGFGFVIYEDKQVADEVTSRNDHELAERKLTVRFSEVQGPPTSKNASRNLRLFVGGFPQGNTVDEKVLKEHFTEYGHVVDAFIIKGRGFGFVTVEFNNERDQQRVLNKEKHFIDGHLVNVKIALPRENEKNKQQFGYHPEERFERGFNRSSKKYNNQDNRNRSYDSPSPWAPRIEPYRPYQPPGNTWNRESDYRDEVRGIYERPVDRGQSYETYDAQYTSQRPSGMHPPARRGPYARENRTSVYSTNSPPTEARRKETFGASSMNEDWPASGAPQSLYYSAEPRYEQGRIGGSPYDSPSGQGDSRIGDEVYQTEENKRGAYNPGHEQSIQRFTHSPTDSNIQLVTSKYTTAYRPY